MTISPPYTHRVSVRRTARAVSGLLFLAACLVAEGCNRATSIDPYLDPELLRAVATEIVAHPSLVRPVLVYPYPLIDDPDLNTPDSTVRARVPDSVIVRRVAVLRNAGIDTTSDVSRRGCFGISVADATRELELKFRREAGRPILHCPTEPHTTVGVALPRPGGPKAPYGVQSDRSTSPEYRDAWTTRVLANTFQQNRVITSGFDLVARRRGGRWQVVETVLLFYVE